MTAPPVPTQIKSDLRLQITDVLTSVFQERATKAATYGETVEHHWALAEQSVLGGKLVRPLLLMQTYDALRKHSLEREGDYATALSIASAVELLHCSFLMHDDVIDGDLTRRGRPNLIGTLLAEFEANPENQAAPSAPPGKYGASRGLHWARTGGILIGDLMLASAHQAFARAPLPRNTHLRLLDLLEHTITESIAGELLDVGLSNAIITPDIATVLAMSTHKTATYTFEFPLRAAAILAASDAALERTLTLAGRHLGLAYQLQDDLLSTFGDPNQHGKDPFSDLREGKQTALISRARQTTEWERIEELFGKPDLSMQEGARLREMLVTCGSQGFVQNLVDDQIAKFHGLLVHTDSEVPADVQRVLLDLAQQLEGRKS